MCIKDLIASIPIKKVGIKELLTPDNKLVGLAGIVLLVVYLIGAANALMHGHHAYGVTRQHPWGLLIVMYIFFVGTSTGLAIIGSFGHVFGLKIFDRFGLRVTWLAIAMLLPGFAIILLEIGHPVTMMIYNILSPGLTSAIWWMGTLYSLVLVFLIGEFIIGLTGDHKTSRLLGIGGLLADVAAFATLGSIFGYLVARPAVNGPFLPLYFILTATVAGAFLIFVVYGIKYKNNFPDDIKAMLITLAKVLGLLLAVLMFFDFWAIMTGLYGRMPERADTVLYILSTKSYWIGEILLGAVIPFVIILMSKGKNLGALVWASFFGLVGIFFMRYDMVHNAQVFPMQTLKLREYQLPPSLVEYTPSSTEWMIALGAIGLAILIYQVGTKLFDLEPHDEHH
jgi:molybdopterin-containing oxidoreductase family membrane subunit